MKRPRQAKVEDTVAEGADAEDEEGVPKGSVFDIEEGDWVAEVLFLEPLVNSRLNLSAPIVNPSMTYVIPSDTFSKPMLIPLPLIVDPTLWVPDGAYIPACYVGVESDRRKATYRLHT